MVEDKYNIVSFLKLNFGTILIACALIITGSIIGSSYLNKGKLDPTISVIGLGEESFDSDLIVWNSSFCRKNIDLKTAYAELNADLQKLKNYLNRKGVSANDIIIQAANIQKEYSNEYDENGNLRATYFSGYNITQQVKIQSKNVDLVEKVSREVSELIDAGIELNSLEPEYYYTKLAQLKLKMIEEATRDAHERAEKIAVNAEGALENLKNAEMGVFQITAENSSEEYEWGGSFNTNSRRKTANITIRLKYEID